MGWGDVCNFLIMKDKETNNRWWQTPWFYMEKIKKTGCFYKLTTQISVKNRRKWACQVWDTGLNSRKRWVIVKWLGRNKYGNKNFKKPKMKTFAYQILTWKLVQTDCRAKRLSSESRSKLVCILPSGDRVRGTQILIMANSPQLETSPNWTVKKSA